MNGNSIVGLLTQKQEASMRKLIGLLLLALMVPLAQAKLVTKVVHYQEGDTKFNGYLAYDTKFKGKRPGIL